MDAWDSTPVRSTELVPLPFFMQLPLFDNIPRKDAQPPSEKMDQPRLSLSEPPSAAGLSIALLDDALAESPSRRPSKLGWQTPSEGWRTDYNPSSGSGIGALVALLEADPTLFDDDTQLKTEGFSSLALAAQIMSYMT